jgi:hypothetical protein
MADDTALAGPPPVGVPFLMGLFIALSKGGGALLISMR